MARYRVLDRRGIEHGTGPGTEKIYFPLGTENVPKTMSSGGHGRAIPTDVSGFIDLEPHEARALQDWQIPYFDGIPVAAEDEGKLVERARVAGEAEADRLEKEKKEFEEFQEFKKSRAAKAKK